MIICLYTFVVLRAQVYRISNPAVESAMTTSRFKPSKSAATNAMLLSVSFYVIFSTLPATLVYVLMTMFPEGEYFDAACRPLDLAVDVTWHRYVVYSTVQKIVNETCLSHYACNFFLFTLTGPEFRRELCRAVFRCGQSRNRGATVAENGATEYSMTAAAVHRTQPGRESLPASEVEELPPSEVEELHLFVQATA